ncbi:MAG: thioredoxin-dependent thiol peroxidase [Nitriliruptorales bacterium]
MNVEVGQEAPDFSLQDAEGKDVALSDLRGRPVILYFYPKDDTPGCTTQACDIRDAWGEFEDAGATVLGVSPDPVESHARFRDKYGLPFTLLADPDREAIDTYGVWGRKTYGGREYDTVIRSTVLVDREGSIAQVWPDVKASDHADLVLEALAGLE